MASYTRSKAGFPISPLSGTASVRVCASGARPRRAFATATTLLIGPMTIPPPTCTEAILIFTQFHSITGSCAI